MTLLLIFKMNEVVSVMVIFHAFALTSFLSSVLRAVVADTFSPNYFF